MQALAASEEQLIVIFVLFQIALLLCMNARSLGTTWRAFLPRSCTRIGNGAQRMLGTQQVVVWLVLAGLLADSLVNVRSFATAVIG